MCRFHSVAFAFRHSLKPLFPCIPHRAVAKTVVKNTLRPLQVPHGNDKGRGVLPQPTDQNLRNIKQKTIGTTSSMKKTLHIAGHYVKMTRTRRNKIKQLPAVCRTEKTVSRIGAMTSTCPIPPWTGTGSSGTSIPSTRSCGPGCTHSGHRRVHPRQPPVLSRLHGPICGVPEVKPYLCKAHSNENTRASKTVKQQNADSFHPLKQKLQGEFLCLGKTALYGMTVPRLPFPLDR